MTTPAFKTADLMDAHPDSQACVLPFRDFGGRKSFCGKIQTVSCQEDNLLVRRSLEQRVEGDVLVVDGAGSLRRALVGDVLGGLAAANGWSGIVVHGAVRDVEALQTIDLGVRALGTNPQRGERTGAGQTNVAVAFGGVEFKPGEWLYADADGVIVSKVPLHG